MAATVHSLVTTHRGATAAWPPSCSQLPPLMNFHLLIGDASSSPFALVKTEIKMCLSLIKRIHVPRFALWVAPRFTNHLWPRDLNGPRVGHQTAFGLTFDHPRGHIWPDGLVKISISSMDGVISATEWSDAIAVEANNGFDAGGRSWSLIVQVVKRLCDLFIWWWMSPDFMMSRWRLPLGLFDAGRENVTSSRAGLMG